MAAVLSEFSDWFWNPRFWLPGNVTWKDLISESEDVYYPRLGDIFLPSIGLGICLLFLRYVYARLVVIPTGRYFGIKDPKKQHVTDNPILEAAFKKSKSPDSNAIMDLTKKTSMSEKQVQRWMRIRNQQDAPSTMKKFEDCSWHFLFYVVLFWYGLYTLWDKPWFSKTINCWIGWPKQHVTTDVYWYYNIELGFYWSLLFSLSTDHKRKDFTAMVTHHVVTIVLVFFSFVVNFVRIGSLVLCVHDAVDYLLAAAKLATYIKKEALSTFLFVMFLFVWIVTRLILYPFYVVYSASIESEEVKGSRGSYTFLFFNGLLIVLQILHILWTYMIIRIAYRKLTHGQVCWANVWDINVGNPSVLYSASIESQIVPGLTECPNHRFFNGLLYTLQLLHILWTYMIYRIAIRKMTQGKMNDVRSDSEGDDVDISEDEDHKTEMNNCIKNGLRTRSKARGDKCHQ